MLAFKIHQLIQFHLSLSNFIQIPIVMFALFLGPWSDRKGRKTLIILPFIGQFLFCIVYILNYFFFYELYADFLLFENINSIFGSWVLFFIGCYGYIVDTTSPDSRCGLFKTKKYKQSIQKLEQWNQSSFITNLKPICYILVVIIIVKIIVIFVFHYHWYRHGHCHCQHFCFMIFFEV